MHKEIGVGKVSLSTKPNLASCGNGGDRVPRKLIVSAIFVFITFSTLSAQIFPSFGGSRKGTTGFQFLKIQVDPRSAAMAGAASSFINDPSALYWNPAGITQVDSAKIHIQGNYTSYFAGTSNSYASIVWKKNQTHFFGVQVQSFSSGDMDRTTEFNPTGTGQKFSYNSFLLGFSYAQILTDNFSYGVSTKYVRDGIQTVATNNVLFDLGFQYNVGWQDLRFSVGISNFGVNVTPSGNLKVLKLNGEQEINNFESVAVPAIFRIGFSKEFFKNTDHNLKAAVQLNHPTDNAETYSLGFEYGLKKLLFVRSGVEVGANNDPQYGFGFGVKAPKSWGGLRIDYSFNTHPKLENIHRIGLTLKILNK